MAKSKKVKTVNKLPKGYRRTPGAAGRAPKGTYWADNGQSYFSGKHKHVLVRENWAKTPQQMTRKELAEELYTSYAQTGNTTVGGRKLTKQEFVKRYLNGIGYAKGFSKPELEQLVTRERNGTGTYARQLNKHVKPK